jgi:hypothetical protein
MVSCTSLVAGMVDPVMVWSWVLPFSARVGAPREAGQSDDVSVIFTVVTRRADNIGHTTVTEHDEPLILLGVAASATERVELGTRASRPLYWRERYHGRPDQPRAYCECSSASEERHRPLAFRVGRCVAARRSTASARPRRATDSAYGTIAAGPQAAGDQAAELVAHRVTRR